MFLRSSADFQAIRNSWLTVHLSCSLRVVQCNHTVAIDHDQVRKFLWCTVHRTAAIREEVRSMKLEITTELSYHLHSCYNLYLSDQTRAHIHHCIDRRQLPHSHRLSPKTIGREWIYIDVEQFCNVNPMISIENHCVRGTVRSVALQE